MYAAKLDSAAVTMVLVPRHRHFDEDGMQAKRKELHIFKALNVFEEVEDIGQKKISVRWVITRENCRWKQHYQSKASV